MTDYREIFSQLSAPFEPEEVKSRVMPGNRECQYVTARTVMNRLDLVVGPENWEDEYSVYDNLVVCRLTVDLPVCGKYTSGKRITKLGLSGIPQMNDPADSPKAGGSEALKNAAVRFGIARYLYEDGVVVYSEEGVGQVQVPQKGTQKAQQVTQKAPQKNYEAPVQRDSKYSIFDLPKVPRGVFPWVKNLETHYQNAPLARMMNSIASEKKFPFKTTEWTNEQMDVVVSALIKSIKSAPYYNGEFDHISEADSVKKDDIFVARQHLLVTLRDLFKKSNPGVNPTKEQLAAVLEAVSPLAPNGEGSIGEVATSISAISDTDWLRNITDLARSKVVDVAEEDDIPF